MPTTDGGIIARKSANPVIMHMNYCRNDMSIPYVFQKARGWGYDGVECHVETSMKDYPSFEAYIADVGEWRERCGFEHIYFGYSFREAGDPDPAVRGAATERAAAFFTLAKEKLGVTLSNISAGVYILREGVPLFDFDKHGSAAASEEVFGYHEDSMKQLAGHMEKIGVKLALETHMCVIHDIPEATVRFIEAIGSPNIGVNFDYGNYYWHEQCKTLKQTFDSFEGRILYFHLKNSIKLPNLIRFQTQLSEGQIDHREYLAYIRDRKIAAPIVLEAPREGDREWFAKEDGDYIRAVMEDLDF